jgi:predicted DNA-binding transcriptional regulator YafY
MRRADRLFEIVQMLRRKQRTRAADLAAHLRVSERSIYRDIRDLVARGVPIEGEAGVGYIMRPGFDLPPLMLNETEVEALLMGARIVQSWADPELATSATTAMDKIRAVSPETVRKQLDFVRLWAPAEHAREPISIDQAALRRAIRNQQKVSFTYCDLNTSKSTKRTVQPLIMAFYGPIWLLAAWCENRSDFRVFRVDRISNLAVLETKFLREAGRTAEDFLRRCELRERGKLHPRLKADRPATIARDFDL